MSKKRNNQVQNLILIFLGMISILVVSFAVTSRPHKTSTRAEEPPAKTRYIDELFTELVQTELRYSTTRTDQYGLLDIYYPKTDTLEKRPAIIWIHGGGFTKGSKEAMSEYAEYFAKRGYVAVSINYRLGTVAPVLRENVPLDLKTNRDIVNAETDAQTAVRWLRTNATLYKVDPDKIFVGGFSAGAVTALLVAYDSENKPSGEYDGISQTVSAVVSHAGLVEPGMMIANDPPLIMFHAEKDTLVPFSLAQAVHERAIELEIVNEFNSYPETHHGVGTDILLPKAALFLSQFVGGIGTQPIVIPEINPDNTTETLDTPPDAEAENREGQEVAADLPVNNKLVSFMRKYSQRICGFDKQKITTILRLFPAGQNVTQDEIGKAYDQVCGQEAEQVREQEE